MVSYMNTNLELQQFFSSELLIPGGVLYDGKNGVEGHPGKVPRPLQQIWEASELFMDQNTVIKLDRNQSKPVFRLKSGETLFVCMFDTGTDAPVRGV